MSRDGYTLKDDRLITTQNLINELDSCQEGKAWKQYENICMRILTYLFVPTLEMPRMQLRTESGIDIRDAVFPNRSRNDNWRLIRDDYDGRYIVFEFKNYSKDGREIDKQTILQLGNYLKRETIGRFGIICSKKHPSNSGLEKRKEIFKDERKLILFMNNEHLKEMLMRKYNNEDPSNVIIGLIDEFNFGF